MNASHDGVVCPDFIREQWRERLIIDLDPSYPLDLTLEEQGLAADLSFGGYVTRCTFPYAAIYVVADRSTGRGIVLDQHMPESVKRARGAKGPGARPESKASLQSVVAREGADASGSPPPRAEAGTPPPPDGEDEQAKRRRAAFRVIDGGG